MTASVAAWIWAGGIIAWCAIRYPYQRRSRKVRVTTHRRSFEEKVLLGGATVGLVIIPFVWVTTGQPAALDYAFQSWAPWLGLVCMAAFLWLFHAVHRQLGRHWSITLEIREDHKLVTDGIYRYVRHPMYTSFWLWAIAQALLIPNWIAGPAGLVSIALLVFRRVGKEEAMMRAEFGDQYDAYRAQTKRFIPWIW